MADELVIFVAAGEERAAAVAADDQRGGAAALPSEASGRELSERRAGIDVQAINGEELGTSGSAAFAGDATAQVRRFAGGSPHGRVSDQRGAAGVEGTAAKAKLGTLVFGEGMGGDATVIHGGGGAPG